MVIKGQEQFDVVRRFLHRVWDNEKSYDEEIEDYLDKLENALLAYNGVKVIE